MNNNQTEAQKETENYAPMVYSLAQSVFKNRNKPSSFYIDKRTNVNRKTFFDLLKKSDPEIYNYLK